MSDRDSEPPPVFRRWSVLYGIVILTLALLIVAFTLLTRALSP